MTSNKRRCRVLFTLIALAVAITFTACSKEADTPEPTMTAAQEKQQSMDWAHAHGETIFVYEGDTDGIAICNGTTRLASLKEAGQEYRFKLTSQESLNLFLCKRNPETGNYSSVQDLGGANPGDYLLWNLGGSLRWTRYIPR